MNRTSVLPDGFLIASSSVSAQSVRGEEKRCLSTLFKIKGPSKAGRVIKLDLEDF